LTIPKLTEMWPSSYKIGYGLSDVSVVKDVRMDETILSFAGCGVFARVTAERIFMNRHAVVNEVIGAAQTEFRRMKAFESYAEDDLGEW